MHDVKQKTKSERELDFAFYFDSVSKKFQQFIAKRDEFFKSTAIT